MAKLGRPLSGRGDRVFTYLNKDRWNRFKKRANAHGMKTSQLVRLLIVNYLDDKSA